MRLLRIISLRIAVAIPILFLVSLGTFSLTSLLPGDPARTLAGGDAALPADIARVREQMRLDDPFLKQYVRWLDHAIHFDFGSSLVSRLPVRGEILQRMPATLSIAVFALVVSLLLGLAAGLVAGARPGTAVDKVSVALATGGVAIPSFVVAILFVQLFALHWRVFPSVRYVNFGDSPSQWLRSIALPGLALGALSAGALSRQLRAGLVDSVNADYVRTSWAVGSGRLQAIGKHALRNSAIPSVTVMASQITYLFGGTIIIEQLFAINGIGQYALGAVTAHDIPAIQGTIIWYVLIQLTVYLLMDIVLMVLNPRLSVR